jgi:hypothetical protein
MIILDVDTRITNPGRFINTVTAAALSWLSKIIIADLAKFTEAYAFGVEPQLSARLSFAV